MDLNTILIGLHGLSKEEKLLLAQTEFSKLYLTGGKFGILMLHDGERVIFHENRFDHAFFTSTRIEQYPDLKDRLDDSRVARLRWIGEVIAGRVPQSACWEVIGRHGRPGIPNRLYVVYSHYVVWLEPRDADKAVPWKFSTAYQANPKYIRDKTKGGTCLWRFTQKETP